MEGEDGEPAWTLARAAKECSKKLRVPISEHVVSKWRTKMEKLVKTDEQFGLLVETTVEQLAKQAQSGVNLAEVVDVQIMMMIAKVHSDEGIAAATKFIRELTGLKRAIVAEREQAQGVIEYQESVEKLKKQLARLVTEMKAKGHNVETLDEINKRTVEKVDEMLRLSNARKK
jgi:hypothetical protein